MPPRDIESLLINYVNRNANVYCIQWDPTLSEKLLIDPFTAIPTEQNKIAHYFLLVATITDSTVIGRAENARALMIYLHECLDDFLFSIHDQNHLQDLVQQSPIYEKLGREKNHIPNYLASVNRFVRGLPQSNLIHFATSYQNPHNMIMELMKRMDILHIDKAWMYLRWMTRSLPDLALFSTLSPQDLQVPMTSNIQAVACCLGLCPSPDGNWWQDPDLLDHARASVTQYAKTLFPTDPCKIDYPFYLLGRWIRGKPLNPQLLRRYLIFLQDVYHQTGTTPVTYDIVSREMSSFEANVQRELEKLHVLFYYESHKFHLPNEITYLPDFILPKCKIRNKTVLLEPHGIWTQKTRRTVRIGRRQVTVYAYPPKNNRAEKQFTDKLRIFKELYGRDYYLILIVPNQVFDRVKNEYPASYDAVYMGSDLPKIIYELQCTLK